MYTVAIGRRVLDAYNQAHDTDYTPERFFNEVVFKKFLDSNKYVFYIRNSPFGQMKKGQSVDKLTPKERLQKLEEFHQKVKIRKSRDASVAFGFPASDEEKFNTTSGLVTDIQLEVPDDDVYLSWIGAATGVGIAGGFILLFDHPDILLKIVKGWDVYRRFLDDPTIELAPNKLTSWNGQWLNYVNSADYSDDFDFATLNNLGFFKQGKSSLEINTVSWARLFFNIARALPEEATTMMVYAYSFGQMNKTLGFFPLQLQAPRKLIRFYKLLFGENAALTDLRTYDEMYGVHFKAACAQGAIGLKALEPLKLRPFYSPDKMPKLKKKSDPEKDYKDNIIPFRIFKTWLLAMITKNKEEQLDFSERVAKALYNYRRSDKKGSTKFANNVTQLLQAGTKGAFLKHLTEIVQSSEWDAESLGLFKELRDFVHYLPPEEFRYFNVLLKFDYAYQERNG
ncbi:MAG: hypothetical protein D6694_05105 [Gammaproteobacteria bacterium]|nr:MAG: hypothetical protein D6694_05105 [Gammaproteobacteria bacterium]